MGGKLCFEEVGSYCCVWNKDNVLDSIKHSSGATVTNSRNMLPLQQLQQAAGSQQPAVSSQQPAAGSQQPASSS